MDDKSLKSSSKKAFTPAFLVNPFAIDSQNTSASIQQYLTEFEKANFRKIFIVVLDLFQDTSGCVKQTVDMLEELAIPVSGAEIVLASSLLFKAKEFPANFSKSVLMSDAADEYEFIRRSFNENVNGLKHAVNNWISSIFSALEKAGHGRSLLELKEFAFLESVVYLRLYKMGVPCTLHPGKLDNFLSCLLNGPSFINKKMLHYSLPKFSSLFCVEDSFFRKFNQGVMLAYLRNSNPEEGFYYSKIRADGVKVSVQIYPALDLPDELPSSRARVLGGK